MCDGVFSKEPVSSFGAYPEHFAHLLYAYHVRVLSKHRAIGISYAYYWLQETTSILPSLDDILRPRSAFAFPAVFATRPGGKGIQRAASGEAVIALHVPITVHRRAAPKSSGAREQVSLSTALSLQSGLPKPFLGPRSSLKLTPSSRRAPRR